MYIYIYTLKYKQAKYHYSYYSGRVFTIEPVLNIAEKNPHSNYEQQLSQPKSSLL